MELEAGFAEGVNNGGLGFEVLELGDDVAADERGEFGLGTVGWVERLLEFEGVFDVREPEFGLGKFFKRDVIERGFEGAAIGVAAEDDVAARGELQRRTRLWRRRHRLSREIQRGQRCRRCE